MDFYYLPGSPPCRAVLMTAKALGIDLNLKITNLATEKHLTPEFIKINPQHTIPTLVDNGFALWESRAITVYLVEKYGKNSSLYPTSAEERAIVNQRLYFDMGTLYLRFADYAYPQIFTNAPPNPEKLEKLEEALDFFNTFLKGQRYAAGDTLTVADISLVATVSTVELMDIDLNKYPNIVKWFKLCKETVPGYDINQSGLKSFKSEFLN